MVRFAALVCTFSILALSTAGGAWAEQSGKGDLVVGEARARATIPHRPGATFLTITNRGPGDDRLIAASSPLAARAELHSHSMAGGVMKMRKVEAVPVPAGAVAKLEPGGYHIMLFDLARPLAEGEEFPLTLRFEKAGDIAVSVTVEAMTAGQ